MSICEGKFVDTEEKRHSVLNRNLLRFLFLSQNGETRSSAKGDGGGGREVPIWDRMGCAMWETDNPKHNRILSCAACSIDSFDIDSKLKCCQG